MRALVHFRDIGLLLRERIRLHFKSIGAPISIKYLDPSYLIRSVPASASDGLSCSFLAQNAVHAGMAGKTDLLIGIWNNVYTHVPIHLAISERKKLDPMGRLWSSVPAATGQPPLLSH